MSDQQQKQATEAQKRQEGNRSRIAPIPWFIAACATLVLLCTIPLMEGKTRPDTGATIADYQGMTRDEIQDELDQAVKDSMMTISVAARATVDGSGTVRINAVNDKSNTFSQRFSLIQDDRVAYESGAVAPGQVIESCQADGIHAGEAFVEIQALDTESLEDHGNPTRVKVEIVESQAQASDAADS